MKILQVTNFFKPSWESGGPARVAYEISRELQKMGHNITIYTTDGFKRDLNVLKNRPIHMDGFTVYYFDNILKILVRKLLFLTPYFLPFILAKEIDKFDIIHIHEGNALMGTFVCFFANKYKKPFVIQGHGSFPHNPIITKYKLFFGYKLLKNASKILALSKKEVDYYINLGIPENKIELIPNGINLNELENVPFKGQFKHKYKLNGNKIVLYLGRLNKSKGIDLLFESFSEVVRMMDNVTLVVVGPDDGYRKHLEKLAETLGFMDRILFTGFVSENERKEALIDADVFVTPKFSGFPLTFIEACACGTPIITTNMGDELGWIRKVGYVVNYDKYELKQAILKLLGDEKLRKKFGENGKDLVINDFNWRNIASQVEQVYNQILQQ